MGWNGSKYRNQNGSVRCRVLASVCAIAKHRPSGVHRDVAVRILAGIVSWWRKGTVCPVRRIVRRFGPGRVQSVAEAPRPTALRGWIQFPPSRPVDDMPRLPGFPWPGPTSGLRAPRGKAAAARGRTSPASSTETRPPPPRRETHYCEHRTSGLRFGLVYVLLCRPPSLPTRLVFGWFVAAAKEKAGLPSA